MLNCKYCELQSVGQNFWGEKKEHVCTNKTNSHFNENLGYAKDYNAGVCFTFSNVEAYKKCSAYCKSESAWDNSR